VLGTVRFIRPIANLLGTVEDLTLLGEESCRAAFSPFAEGSGLDLMGAVLPDGTLLCAHEVLPEGATLAGRAYAQEALTATDFVVGDIDVSPLTGNMVLPILYPIRNTTSGKVLGAMVAMMKLDTLQPVDLIESLPPGAFAEVTDRSAHVLTRYPVPGDERTGESIAQTEKLKRAQEDESGTLALTNVEGVDSYIAFLPVEELGDDAFVFVGMPREGVIGEAVSELWRDSLGILVFTGIAFGIALVGSQWFVVGPVRAMERAAKRITAGDLEVRLGPDYRAGELGELSRSFDSMAASIEARNADIAELNASLERRVEERTAALEEANRELEAFSYSVSHDLRSPLRAIDGFSELVELEMGDQMPETAQRYMARVRAGTQRMGVLIDDLLQFSRVGRQEMVRRTFSLDSLVHDSIEDLQSRVGATEVDWQVGDLGEVDADPAMVRRVTDNLIGNAIKFSSTGDHPTIEIGRFQQGGESVFFVRDNGVGFDMAYAEKLFMMFQRLHLPEEFVGTGVGLAIVHRVISKHGGRVWAEADVGSGATFYFTLGEAEATDDD
jgi:signal transduction histidine kinase